MSKASSKPRRRKRSRDRRSSKELDAPKKNKRSRLPAMGFLGVFDKSKIPPSGVVARTLMAISFVTLMILGIISVLIVVFKQPAWLWLRSWLLLASVGFFSLGYVFAFYCTVSHPDLSVYARRSRFQLRDLIGRRGLFVRMVGIVVGCFGLYVIWNSLTHEVNVEFPFGLKLFLISIGGALVLIGWLVGVDSELMDIVLATYGGLTLQFGFFAGPLIIPPLIIGYCRLRWPRKRRRDVSSATPAEKAQGQTS